MTENSNAKFCSNCGEKIENTESQFCSHCGNELKNEKSIKIEEKPIENNTVSEEVKTKNTEIKYDKNPVLAALLSFFLICLGQFYNGQILKGILFIFVAIVINLINPWLTLLFLIYSAYDAYKNAKYIKTNNGNYFYTEAI